MPSLPQAGRPGQDDTDAEEVVLGVDTHKEVHVAAVITVLGVLVSSRSFPATAAGYRQMLAWAARFGSCDGQASKAPAPTAPH